MMISVSKTHLRLSVLFLMGTFGIMGGGLLAPALPSLAEPFGVREGAVGLVLGVYTLSAALSLPFTGLMIDMLGRRKVALACLVIDGIFGLLCTMAPSFTLLLVFRFFQGIGIAALIPVAVTVISDWYSGRERLKIMGYMSGTISFSAIFIPVIGGFLAGINWRYPFMVYGFSIFLAVLYFFVIPETGAKAEEELYRNKVENYFRNLKSTLRIGEVLVVFLHALVLYFLLYTMVSYLPLLLSESYRLSLTMGGVALGFQAFISSLIASQASRVDRILSHQGKMIGGYFFLFGGFSLIPLWQNHYQFTVSLLFLGVGMGMIMPAIYHRATTAGPKELVGSIIALFTTVKFIGMTLAPVLLRTPYDVYGPEGPFFFSGLLAIIWCAVVFFTGKSSSDNRCFM